MSLQGTIIQTSSGNRILIQGSPLVAGQLASLPAGVQFQPQGGAAVTTPQQPTQGGTTTPQQFQLGALAGGKPLAVGQPTQQVLNIAGNAGQQQQIVIHRTPGPNGTQNQNIYLRTIPSNLIQLQNTTGNTGTTQTPTAALSGQVVLSQPGLQAGQLQLPQGQMATIGQPQVLGGLNMVNNAHSININVLPAPVQNMSGMQTVQGATSGIQGAVNIQPKPSAVAGQQQNVNIPGQGITFQQMQQGGVAGTTATTATAQQQGSVPENSVKWNTVGQNINSQQLNLQQLQSVGLLQAGFSSQTPQVANVAPQQAPASVAQILQTVSATAAKQVTNQTTLQHLGQTGGTVTLANSNALPSGGQQQTLPNLQAGQQMALGAAGQLQTFSHTQQQLPLLKPKQELIQPKKEPCESPSPQIHPSTSTLGAGSTSIGQLTTPRSHVPMASTKPVNIPSMVATAVSSAQQLSSPQVLTMVQTVPGRASGTTTVTTATGTTSTSTAANPSIAALGLKNIHNVVAPPNVNIQNMPQLQVQNLSMPISTAMTTQTVTSASTSAASNVTSKPFTPGPTSVQIHPKVFSLPTSVSPSGQAQPQLQAQPPVQVQASTQLLQSMGQGQQQVKVQTIQLSSSNQELLRKIQEKINQLQASPNRNSELNQKVLQQMVEMQRKIIHEAQRVALQVNFNFWQLYVTDANSLTQFALKNVLFRSVKGP